MESHRFEPAASLAGNPSVDRNDRRAGAGALEEGVHPSSAADHRD